ncbi:MAG: hypothetical protein AAGA93_16330 [Actinomycetota bacterium]
MSAIKMSWRRAPGDARLAASALVLGFLVNVQLSGHTTVNGVVTSCSYLGLGEMVGGAAAALLGLRLAVNAWPSRENLELGERARGPVLALAGVLTALGVLLVLKGGGVLWSPCG